MYIDLKTAQAGGNSILPVSKLNPSDKFYLAKPIESYDKIIAWLEDFCKNESTKQFDLDQVLSIVSEYTNDKQKSDSNLFNAFRSKIDSLTNRTKIKSSICKMIQEKVLPTIKSEKNLQERLIDRLKNIQTSGQKINLGEYMNFAKEHDMINKSADEIFNKYTQVLDSMQKQNNLVNEYLAGAASATGIMATAQLSKNGHQCTSACKPGNNPLTGDYTYCETAPRQSIFGTKNWDYCPNTKN